MGAGDLEILKACSPGAIQEYERALPLFVKHHGADHPVAAFIREALAELRQA